MSKRFLSKMVLICILVLAVCSTSAMLVVSADEKVATAEEVTSEVKIMHITDIHYIPTYYCYMGDKKENDFATKIKGDPKLMLESYAILETTCQMILDYAKNNKLDYVFLTGDITSNGEKQSLIDVANAMRKLQNDVRATTSNTDFQILAVPGNHDVFNDKHSSFYNTPSGVKEHAAVASREEFIKIYSSLGYPDLSDTEAKAFYEAIPTYDPLYKDDAWNVDGKHLPYKVEGEQAFVNSTTRANLNFDYYEKDTPEDDVDELGGLTYLAYDEKYKMSICGFDTTLSVLHGQETEGEFQKKNIDWYEEKVESKGLKDYTQVIMGHHNIFNHHPKQEQYTSGFVAYAWEETAERLTSMGVKYCFTGHFHANDIATYVSFNNNLLYDIETGATISYGAAIREVGIKTYKSGAQDLVSKLMLVEKADLTYLREKGKIPSEYDDCFIEGNIVDVQKYIDAKLFSPYLANMIDSFIGPIKIEAGIDKLGSKSMFGVTLDLTEIVYVLLDEINTKVLNDYTYTGDIGSLKEIDHKYLGYLHELLGDAIKTPISSDGHTFEDLVLYSYGAHLMGNEIKSEEELPDWVKEGVEAFRSGEKVGEIFDKVLFGEGALYEKISKLATTPIDLTKCTNSKGALKTLLGMIDREADLSAIKLDTLVPKALKVKMIKDKIGMDIDLGKDTLIQYVDGVLDAYYTDAIRAGIGSVLCEIALSFGTDPDSNDGAFGETIVCKLNETDAHSNLGYNKATIEPTIENGRMPSNITVTFGADPSSTRNFVWFTSQFAPSGDIKYREQGSSDWVVAKATSEILPYSAPLMDFGLFTTRIDKNTARHNVRLTALKANTKYEYMLGDTSRDVWTEVGYFKTAPQSGAFEVNIMGDLQGMERLNYERALDKMNKSKKFFDGEEPSFTVNLGDFVDDGKNANQWSAMLNGMSPYWTTQTQVAVVGNHEGKDYESGKKKMLPGRYTNINIEKMIYSPFNFHFDQGGNMFTAKKYYSFDYSDVHFIVLDTNDTTSSGKMSDAQVKWLKDDLTTDKPFKVVLMHKGIFSSGEHANDKEVVAMRAQLAPIFYDNKVAMVFQGHDHTYSETPLLDGNGKESAEGVLYVTVGAMGDKMFKHHDNENVPVAKGKELHDENGFLKGQTFGKLSYDGSKLAYQGYIFDKDDFVKVEDFGKSEPSGNKGMIALWVTLGVVGAIGIVGASIGITKKRNKRLNAQAKENSETNDASSEE